MKLHFVFALAILIKYAGAGCVDSYNTTEGLTLGSCDLCSGNCYPDNTCACSNNIDDCLPSPSDPCPNPDMCCPTGLYYSANESCCIDTPICVLPCSADEKCNMGKCVCDGSKFHNMTIKDFQPKISCDNNAMTATVSKCQLDALGYDTTSIHLRDPSINCTYLIRDVIGGKQVINVQAKAKSNWCGNTMTSDNATIHFYNTITIGIKNSTLITINPISFDISCAFKRDMQTSLQLGNITTQTVNLSGVNGTGSYPVTMAAYKDPSFSTPYQNNEEVVVGSDIYVGTFVTGADGTSYVLRTERCVASPTNNRDYGNSFQLITNGCAQTSVSTEIRENGKSLQTNFRISSFQFQNQPNVYIFCDVRLCENSTGVCDKCNLGRSENSNTATNEVRVNLNIGGNPDFLYDTGKQTAASWALLAAVQLAFVFVKFF